MRCLGGCVFYGQCIVETECVWWVLEMEYSVLEIVSESRLDTGWRLLGIDGQGSVVLYGEVRRNRV